MKIFSRKEVISMNKTIGTIIILVLVLAPAFALADVEIKGTVIKVDNVANQLVVRTDRGEETFILDKSTKGVNNAKEGAKIIVKFTEKDGEPKVTEIVPQEDKTTDITPR